jgi:phasin family protein
MAKAKTEGATAMAEGVETLKATVDQFTTAGNQAFKDNVEKSLTALNELNAHSKKNLEALVASATAATKGAEALGAHAMAYSKQALEDQVSAAKSLAGAKSFQEAIELQTGFAKAALEGYLANFGKLSEVVAASVKETVKPLNERVSALVERTQAA